MQIMIGNKARTGLLGGALLLLSACGPKHADGPHGPHEHTVKEVLDEYRSSHEWRRSKSAFREIVKNYVHGEAVPVSDAQLDEDFETFVTLSEEEVDEFVRTQSCIEAASADAARATEARYYSVNTMHQRHDAFVARPSPRPVTGSGSAHAHAAFSANMLMERTEISHEKPLPKRAAMPGAHFANWQAIADTMTDRAKFDALFLFLDRAQSNAVFEVTSKLDWDSQVSGQVFLAPELPRGQFFSPALFSTYVFKKDAISKYSVFIIISANAQGVPTTPYAGLIDDGDAMYKSETGFSFTYLSTNKNLLNYRFIMGGEAPLAFDLRITTAYPAHPEQPYLTVDSKFTPIATDQKVDRYLKSRATRVLLMVRKGALMRDLIKAYYPNSSAAQLWVDVGAITRSRGFKAKLQAAGLDLAVDVFAKNVWIEKPRVETASEDTAAPMQYRTLQQRTCN